MTKYNDVSLETMVRLGSMVGATVPLQMDYHTVEGVLNVDGEELPVNGTYPDVNQALRLIAFAVDPSRVDKIELVLTAKDSSGREIELSETVDLSNVPADVENGHDTDGNPVIVTRPKSVSTSLQISDVFGDLTIPDDAMVAVVKIEAGRRIETLVPLYKQQNASTRMIELLEKGKDKWTTAEKGEVELIRAGNDAINAIRAKSEVVEAMTPIPIDLWNDEHWS